MRRFVLISAGLGGLSALLVGTLHFLGAFDPLADRLFSFYQSRGFVAEPANSARLQWAEILAFSITGIWAGWCFCELNRISQKVIVFFVFSFLILCASPTLALFGKLFEPVSSFAALTGSAFASIFFGRGELAKRRRNLETLLAKRASEGTFHKLMNSPAPLDLRGQTREITVVTCSLFPAHEDGEPESSPENQLRAANLFQRVVSHFFASKGAYLGEVRPDQVQAFYGLLENDDAGNNCDRAARASLELLEALKALDAECRRRWQTSVETGIGLSSGSLLCGVRGTGEDAYIGASGPEVQFSQRLAGACAEYGCQILFGPEAHRLVEDKVEVRPLEMFFDPASGSFTELYELLGIPETFGERARELRSHYWDGVIFYREGRYAEAISSLSKAREPGKEDPPLEYFFKKAQAKLTNRADDGNAALAAEEETGHSRLLGRL